MLFTFGTFCMVAAMLIAVILCASRSTRLRRSLMLMHALMRSFRALQQQQQQRWMAVQAHVHGTCIC